MADNKNQEVVSEEKTFEGSTKQLTLVNEEDYRNAISQFKAKIAQLVQDGVMTEQTGVKLIVENEYNFFQQIIKVALN